MVKGNNKQEKNTGSTSEHQRVVKLVLLKMTMPYCRVWANNTGMIKTDDRVVRFGLKGSSDILGIYKGLFLGIEVKTGNAVQSKDQKNFQIMVEKMGGIYVVCKDINVNQIVENVEQAYVKRNTSNDND